MKKFSFFVASGMLVALLATIEVQTSFLQSQFFSRYAAQLSYQVGEGKSNAIFFPPYGPYNRQQGFSQLPEMSQRLEERGYTVLRQSQFSQPLLDYAKRGGNPPQQEKLQSGLVLVDDKGAPLYVSKQPSHIYETFDQIPTLLVDSLLFIENRELLVESRPRRNPAIEWDRFGDALMVRATQWMLADNPAPGASTLATQMEKYRYSPGGRTTNAREKLRQMVSASARAYHNGPMTHETRKLIVRNYLNSTPLSARPGFGEVLGIGDGLWAWYGIDFENANQVLHHTDERISVETRAAIFKAALSLLLSQRRPSFYLLNGRQQLSQLTDSYLRLLADADIIGADLKDAAIDQPLKFLDHLPAPPVLRSGARKAVDHLRTDLLALLGVSNFYALDRLDLKVKTSLATDAQERVDVVLHRLKDPEFARQSGLIGPQLLKEEQLDAVRYSVVLYESTPKGNLLRLHTDNLDVPFDINQGSKLDLGSTAKLRTLISYLEVVETLYHRHVDQTKVELNSALAVAEDPIRRWVLEYLAHRGPNGLPQILTAAMERRYSASPWEGFFTAGGLHRFSNFDPRDNSRRTTVAEAFNRSINLVFIRLMRDIAGFYTREIEGVGDLLENPQSPLRRQYLERFAESEGRVFLEEFIRTYRGLNGQAILDKLATRIRPTPYRLAMAFRAVQPESGLEAMAAFIEGRLGAETPPPQELEKLYEKYARDAFNSNDRAYIAKVHPLELWVVKYLLDHPEPNFSQLRTAASNEYQDVYSWLFKTRRTKAQNRRIRMLVEEDAFASIHRQWRRLGYPFDHLVPSYATALGVSADRPYALAELMGIIVNDGVKRPLRQIEQLHFAEGTPYETLVGYPPQDGQKVLSTEVCATVRGALEGIVDSGTARRLKGAFRGSDGQPLALGGKTGTGDHRYKLFAPGGRLIDSKVVNRNALFTFFIGDRHFGVIMAHVGGSQASTFHFTSALAAQLLKTLQPSLQPLLLDGGHSPEALKIVNLRP